MNSNNELALILQTPLAQKLIKRLGRELQETIDQWRGCGSYMIDGQTTEYQPSFYHKQELIWRYVRDAPPESVFLEIGVHGAHSLLLMLLANPCANIVAVDICIWDHTERCVAVLQKAFPNAKIVFMKCTGEEALALFARDRKSFHLIHLDGCHEYLTVSRETRAAVALEPHWLLLDDYDAGEGTCISKVLRELHLAPYEVSNYPYRNCIVRPSPQRTLMVTAYFDLAQYQSTVPLHDAAHYVEYGRRLMSHGEVEWVIFTDSPDLLRMYPEFQHSGISVVQQHLFDSPEEKAAFQGAALPSEAHPVKDTAAYIAVQNKKMELVSRALVLKKEYECGAWIDFGLFQYPIVDTEASASIYAISRSEPQALCIPGFEFPNQTLGGYPLYEKPIWSFAGTFFIGPRTALKVFQELAAAKLTECLPANITWEINIWHWVATNSPGLCYHYPCSDHGLTMFTNYFAYNAHTATPTDVIVQASRSYGQLSDVQLRKVVSFILKYPDATVVTTESLSDLGMVTAISLAVQVANSCSIWSATGGVVRSRMLLIHNPNTTEKERLEWADKSVMACLDIFPHLPDPLAVYMNHHGSDKATPGKHNYTEVYHGLFKDLRESTQAIFEVGIGTNNLDVPSSMGLSGRPGASLYAWRDYFPQAHVYAADIDRRILFSDERISTFFTDQTNGEALRNLWTSEPFNSGASIKFDVFIDDGLHEVGANLLTLESSVHMVRPGGFYIVEDIVQSEIPQFEQWIADNAHRFASVQLLKLPLEANMWDNNLMIVNTLVK